MGGTPSGALASQVAPDHNTGDEGKTDSGKDQANYPIRMTTLSPVPAYRKLIQHLLTFPRVVGAA
jgi:hypothetical protein